MHTPVGLLLLLGISAASVAVGQSTLPSPRQAPPPAVPAQPWPAQPQGVVGGTPLPTAQSLGYAPSITSSIARWQSLRSSDNQPFSAYSSFLIGHRGWPGEAALRRSAERQSATGAVPTPDALAFYSVHPPLTPSGHAGHAFALLASGRVDEARAAARRAWIGGQLPEVAETRLLGAFGGALSPADHDARIDALLSEGAVQAAGRALPWASPAARPVFEARLALQQRSPSAPGLVMGLGPAAAGDPGLVIDRAAWMRATGDSFGARQFLARPRQLSRPPANPEKFMEAKVALARGAANDRQWTTAFDIARQVEDIYEPGTVVRERSFGERDEYTNLTWLAGTTALQQLGRPADAVRMFELYARAAASPQTQTKGLYWAGRAAEAAGQRERARALFAEAARHYDQFYGQLSAERVGQALPPPPVGDAVQPTPAERAAFNGQPLVQAIRYLSANGSWRDTTDFLRALAQHAQTDRERVLAAQLGREIGRQDLGVLVARAARADGSFDFKRSGFPEVRVPPAQSRLWSMVHGITRQESLFDREAVSHAGARGLMQLMPATARQVSGWVSVPYDQARLTRDPDYNVLLGSTYFSRLLDQWGGSYPLAVASYNAGAGNVRRWVRENGDPRTPGVSMVEWIEQIPFFETRNYVQRVLENAVVYDLMHPQRAGSPPQNRLSHYLGKPGRPG